MRARMTLALLALATLAAPASADTGDLDGDGCPDLAAVPALDAASKEPCRFAWDTAADLGQQVSTACRGAALEACDEHPLDEVAAARKSGSVICLDLGRPVAGTPAAERWWGICHGAGSADSGRALAAVSAQCTQLPQGSDACGMAAATVRSKHDAAMAAIQNTR